MSFVIRYLVLILVLALVGCSSDGHGHHSKKQDEAEAAAVKKVLDARNDIRQVISHTPQNALELAAANQDPSALVFRAHDYIMRLRTIPLKGCPDDFKAAFVKYAEAWNDRVAVTPMLVLPLGPGKAVPEETDPTDAQLTETTWHALQQVAAEYSGPPQKSGGF